MSVGGVPSNEYKITQSGNPNRKLTLAGGSKAKALVVSVPFTSVMKSNTSTRTVFVALKEPSDTATTSTFVDGA